MLYGDTDLADVSSYVLTAHYIYMLIFSHHSMFRGNTRSSSQVGPFSSARGHPEPKQSLVISVRLHRFTPPHLLYHISAEHSRILRSSRTANGTSSIAAPRAPVLVLPLSRFSPSVFVKLGNPNFASEARTQAYLFEQARSHSRAPSLPRECGVFNDGADSTYLAMEHVDASSFRV